MCLSFKVFAASAASTSKEYNMTSSSHKKIQSILQQALASSAFRHGTSAFRYGLIQQGISDHLPISVQTGSEEKLQLKLISWNLLADVHLYNNFMNVSGSACLREELLKNNQNENLYCTKKENKLYYFFSELAQFLYKKKGEAKLNITAELLRQFVSIDNQVSGLARSRDPVLAKEKSRQVEKARSEIIELFIQHMQLDTIDINEKIRPSANAHEYKIAIRHSLELIHHIEHKAGALKWDNRLTLLSQNSRLKEQLSQVDFLCLQECTQPNDIYALFQKQDQQYGLLTYQVDDKTNDHCVIIYNKSRFEQIGAPLYFALEGKKPCIFAHFQEKSSGKSFIVGSVHHPGGNHDYINDILGQVQLLQTEMGLPFYVLGDYNHTTSEFDERATTPLKHVIVFPEGSTMAGSDYGHLNQAVDAVLTHHDSTALDVSVLSEMSVSVPAPTMPFVVDFDGKDNLAYPSYYPGVQRFSEIDDERKANELLKPSLAKTDVIIDLDYMMKRSFGV